MHLSAKLYTIILFLACRMPGQIIAQETKDCIGILEGEVSKKINKSLEISLSEEIRSKNFLEEVDRLATGVGVAYKHPRFKDLKVGGSYELLSYFNQNLIDENKHRFSAYVQYKYSYGYFDFSLRSRFQSTYQDESTGNYKVNPKNKLRNRLNVAYNIYGTPYTPYTSFELTNTVGLVNGDYFDRYRIRLGFEYRLNKQSSIDIFSRYSKDINQKEPAEIVSFGLSYNFKL